MGTGKSVQCPYHAWTYDLDGSLRAAPRSEREPGFETEGLSLVKIRLETWGPFLFVNPDDDAPPLADTLGPVTELVPVDDLVFHVRDDSELEANWKIACENYLECYHCPVAHKGFSAAYDVDPDEYRLEPIAEHVLSQFAQSRREGEAQFHFVWPNLRLNAYAGTPNLSIGPLLPTGRSARQGSSTTSSRRKPIPRGSTSCSSSTARSAPRTVFSSSASRKACARGSSRRDSSWGRASSSSARFQELVTAAVA